MILVKAHILSVWWQSSDGVTTEFPFVIGDLPESPEDVEPIYLDKRAAIILALIHSIRLIYGDKILI